MSSTALSLKEHLRKLLPRQTREHRILFGQLQGAPIVTSWYDYPGAILGRNERPLLAWFRGHVHSAQTWIDIGAHYGYTALALSRIVGPAGRVFAFEPIQNTARCLERTRALNGLQQLTVVPVGLGACSQRQPVHLPIVRGMADSTWTHSNCGSETIESIPFDAVWPSLARGDATVHGVKIDVQGMELDVLQGMQESLRRWKPPLAIELHRGVNRQEILAALAGCGYASAGEPIEPREMRGNPEYRDNCSYAFYPSR